MATATSKIGRKLAGHWARGQSVSVWWWWWSMGGGGDLLMFEVGGYTGGNEQAPQAGVAPRKAAGRKPHPPRHGLRPPEVEPPAQGDASLVPAVGVLPSRRPNGGRGCGGVGEGRRGHLDEIGKHQKGQRSTAHYRWMNEFQGLEMSRTAQHVYSWGGGVVC